MSGRLADPGLAAVCVCGEPREAHGGARHLGKCPGERGLYARRFRLRGEDRDGDDVDRASRLVEQWAPPPDSMPPLVGGGDFAVWHGDGRRPSPGDSIEVTYTRASRACPHGDAGCTFGSCACDCAR